LNIKIKKRRKLEKNFDSGHFLPAAILRDILRTMKIYFTRVSRTRGLLEKAG